MNFYAAHLQWQGCDLQSTSCLPIPMSRPFCLMQESACHVFGLMLSERPTWQSSQHPLKHQVLQNLQHRTPQRKQLWGTLGLSQNGHFPSLSLNKISTSVRKRTTGVPCHQVCHQTLAEINSGIERVANRPEGASRPPPPPPPPKEPAPVAFSTSTETKR